MDWFLYDNDLRHERINTSNIPQMKITAVKAKIHYMINHI